MLYAGRPKPRSLVEGQPSGIASAAQAPPVAVVSKIFGEVGCAEEQEALLRHMQLIKTQHHDAKCAPRE